MKNKICSSDMNFSDCELAILRIQVDKAQEKVAKVTLNSPEIKEMISVVENFIKKKNLVCYGGISINAQLPHDSKIYNQDVDLPDYDFFSPDALKDAKELANVYHNLGYSDVEARSGQHHGTYKVFVNYQGMADITSLPKNLFEIIKKKSVRVNGISHVDPNFLRMSMYLELSRPAGDTSRWEKVMKRLTLINKYHPIDRSLGDCSSFKGDPVPIKNEIYNVIKEVFINQGVVFFGGFAMSQYTNYMPKTKRLSVSTFKTVDFDVISHNPETTSEILIERLRDHKINNCKVIKRDAVGEIIPLHYEVQVEAKTVAFIYKPVACHSYNVLKISGRPVKIATIDTILSFYLAFLYSDRPYYKSYSDRILCMADFLFEVQSKNRLKQTGLLKRFSITCYGHQETVEEMRAEKAAKFKEMKNKRGLSEFEEWFLNYKPGNKRTVYKENLRKKKHTQKNGIFLWGYNKKNNVTKRKKKRKYYF